MSAALELVCACTHPCSCSIKQNHDANWSHLKPGSTAMPHDAYGHVSRCSILYMSNTNTVYKCSEELNEERKKCSLRR